MYVGELNPEKVWKFEMAEIGDNNQLTGKYWLWASSSSLSYIGCTYMFFFPHFNKGEQLLACLYECAGFVVVVGLLFLSTVNSYGHAGMVS